MPNIVLPLPIVAELLFGAENSARSLQNLTRYLQFIEACAVVTMGRQTATSYAQTRLSLKRKGRPIPENDMWNGGNHYSQEYGAIAKIAEIAPIKVQKSAFEPQR
nr:hypothetical protein [Nostoc sp. CHAB 5715]